MIPARIIHVNLLFGILAVHLDFISREQLADAVNTWVLDNSKPLAAVLVEQKAISPEQRRLLEALVIEHLKKHQHDPEASLTAISSVDSVKQDLLHVADVDVQAVIQTFVSPPANDAVPLATPELPEAEADPEATSVGPPTSIDGVLTGGGRFRILRPHAKGGIGVVFVAHDEELHREVALKEIQARHADDLGSRSRFLQEAEITGKLEHPGIVPVYGLGQYADGRPYYAMRFIRGDSLKDAIARFHESPNVAWTGEKILVFRQLLGRFVDVCQAMQYAHDRGVLHRDLKPGNIMLGKYGETLVVDWGLAKTVAPNDAAEHTASTIHEQRLQPISGSGGVETRVGSAIGTPAFMSPEQAAGRLDLLGPASDVYSLAATLHCLLTGRSPIAGENVSEVLQKVKNGDILKPRQLNPAIDPALEAICLKGMALRPADRYPSPLALAKDIEQWLADEPVSAYREPPIRRANRWVRKHKPLVSGVAAALLVAALALTGTAFWYHEHQAETARKQLLADADAASKRAVAAEKVRQALRQAQQTRDELHGVLKKTGGVFELLNQPALWEARIKSARGDWRLGQDLADESLDPALRAMLAELDKELTQDQADFDLCLRLDNIRLDSTATLNGEFSFFEASRDYPLAFAQAGIFIDSGKEDDSARIINASAVREHLLASLDYWGYAVDKRDEFESRRRILALARRIDPDPWRDQIRDPARWFKREQIEQIAKEAMADKAFFATMSPEMLALTANLLPTGPMEETWRQAALALHPRDFWLHYDQGYAKLRRDGNIAEAVGYFRVALAVRPNSSAPLASLGSAYLRQKNHTAAIDVYRRALVLDPRSVYCWAGIGYALEASDDLPAAVEAYKKALAINPRHAPGWEYLGSAHSKAKDWPAAIAAYEKSLAIKPNNPNCWLSLGFARHTRKELPEAIKAYNKGLALNPKNANAWNQLGIALRSQLNSADAIDAFKKAVHIDPKHANAWYNLAFSLRQSKTDLSATINALEKSLALDPKNADAWRFLGAALTDSKDLLKAEDAYKQLVILEPQNAKAWNNLGALHLKRGNLPTAIEALNRSISVDPDYAYAWSNLGSAHHKRKDFPSAVTALKKSIALNPKYAAPRFNLGVVLHDMREFQDAIDSFNAALAIDPVYTAAWSKLGDARRELKDLDGAVAAYRKAIELDPMAALTLCRLGQCLRDLGHFGEAVQSLENGHRLGILAPRWPHPSAAWLKECEDLVVLEKQLPAVMKGKSVEPPVLFALADMCRRYLNRHSDAAELYRRAFLADPMTANDVAKNLRYRAACSSALAAAGKGIPAEKLDVKQRMILRQQALDWLNAELKAHAKKLELDPMSAVQLIGDLQTWQHDTELASLRDPKELAELDADQRTASARFWEDVNALSKRARSSFSQTEYKGELGGLNVEKTYPIKMSVGKTYRIDMESIRFDTILRLQDPSGGVIAENDDFNGINLNSRIVFTPRAAGVYRIVATSYRNLGQGTFTITIREFAAPKK